ncbi:GAD-like domain-containing protein [Oceanospirillum sanctuarii]|uniref:GAD-like domain-containing protein n=1 Tax=Oceanospirillum sanctuarii TaxID=1434821 RepID=UPI000A3D1ADB|nr:GAD-like domain-containing protein [Oceanospirillum sanctuarii]
MAIKLQTFIDTHTPGENLQQASAEILARYRDHLPASLLELWQTHGFGFYGDGLIQLINPEQYQDNLWGWLMYDEEDMDRLPIALSAFGDILYFRNLTGEDEGLDEEEDEVDVAFIDPHTSQSDSLVWSLEEFFNDFCCDEEVIEEFFCRSRLLKTRKLKGVLAADEIYYPVPALRLGGNGEPENSDKGDASVQLDLLLQMALNG